MATRTLKERDYVAIAKKKVQRPASMQGYRKLFVYARNKKGKTRFCLSAGVENTLIIDPEGGTDTMESLNPYVYRVKRWQDVQDAYGALRTGELTPAMFGGESNEPFSWVALDGMTRINNMALRFVMGKQEETDLDRQPGFVQQRDYGKSGEIMKQLIYNFHILPINVIFTSQERMRTAMTSDGDEEEEEHAFFAPNLPDAVRAAVNEVAEVIGRMYSVTTEVKGKEVMQRRLWIGLHDRYDTGFRSDFRLPPMIRNPTLPKLVSLMMEGK